MDLFEPVTIRGMALKNRFVMPAMHLNLGFLSRRALAFYEERAKGGVGCISTAAITPDPFISDVTWKGRGTATGFIDRLSETLVRDVHKHNVRIGVQLWTGNMHPAGMWGGYNLGADEITGDWVAPSPRGNMRALSLSEIREIIGNFSQAALRTKEAGFDFVDFNLAHAYLPCQFFSPIYNRRCDEYGGDLERRMRFGIDLIASARRTVGDNFPIEVRLGAHEYMQKGITLEDSVVYARELAAAGADIISVSVADPFPHICPPAEEPAGAYVPLAAAVKEQVNVHVVGVGNIHTRQDAEAALSRGRIDLVGLGRQLIADPYWVTKVAEGRDEDILSCLSCNICCDAVTTGKSAVQCAVNPYAGKEIEGRSP